ncbi:UNVERIFIED_CONTAM: hypothetical protein FKN15_029216 [Acipenser sinensis]
MNLKKTQVMFNKYTTPQVTEVNGIKPEEVNNYVYLGQLVSATENQMCEINRRAKMGWSAFGRLSMVLKHHTGFCGRILGRPSSSSGLKKADDDDEDIY